MDIASWRGGGRMSHWRRWARIGVLAVVAGALLVVACSDPDEDGTSGSTVSSQSSSEAVREGARLYGRHCAECHGETGDRIPISPLKTKAFLDSRGDATLLAVTAEGKGTMPAFGQGRGGPLTAEDVRAVVAYLNSEAGRSSTTLLAGLGRTLYEQNCESCHGPNGDRIPVAPMDAKGFLDSKTDSELSEVILNGKGASPAFGVENADRNLLDPADATAIISFLRYRVQEAAVQSVAIGRDLYVSNCLACHGAAGDRVPDVKLGDAAYLSTLGDGKIISAINQGTETGPAFGVTQGGGFAVTDTAALLAYLKSWSGLNATAALTLPGAGGQGEGLFVTNCSPCHGVAGDQVPGVQLRSDVFLSSRGRPVVRETILVGNDKGMPAWGQSAGGPLSDAQVDSIVNFLFQSAGVEENGSGGGTSSGGGGGGALGDPIFDGQTVSEFFAGNCAACHGAERQGLVGPALLPGSLPQSDEFYFDTIANGRAGTPMPAWRAQGLTDEQIDLLVLFIKTDPNGGAAGGGSSGSSGGGGGDLPPRAQPIFDGQNAKEFYAANCAACHAADRSGLVGPALLPDRLTESNDFYEQTILEGRAGTAMPAWQDRGVTAEQAAALVDYVKSDPNETFPTAGASGSSGGDGGGDDLLSQPLFDGQVAKDFYAANCAACHGADRAGLVGPALLPDRLTEADDFYEDTILNGRAGTVMPAWKDRGVTAEQAAALVAFIKSDPNAAASSGGGGGGGSASAAIFDGGQTADQFYAGSCAPCHGADRQGLVGPALTAQALTESDAFYEETISQGRPGTVMPSWSERGLTPEQIEAMVDFLKGDPGGGGATSSSAPTTGGGQNFGLAAAFLPANYERLDGGEIFRNICSKCHGNDGMAIPQCRLGSREWIGNMSDEGLYVRIARGKESAGMPRWGADYGGPLSTDQVRAVARYLGNTLAQ